MSVYRCVLLLTCAILPVQTAGGQIVVTGEVRSGIGYPLDSALIRVEGTSLTTFSHRGGRYSLTFTALPSRDTVVISAHARGYIPSRVTVLLTSSGNLLNFSLNSYPLCFCDPGDPPETYRPLPARATVADAAGLPDLRNADRHDGEREIRVWLWNQDMDALDFYRIIDRSGSKTGEEISASREKWAFRHDMEDNELCGLPSSTGTIPNFDDVYICKRTDVANRDWAGVWDSLETRGIWKLARDNDRGMGRTAKSGAPYLTVETWDGKTYRIGDHRLTVKADSTPRTDAEKTRALILALP